MELVVDVNARFRILVEVLREVATLAVAERCLDIILESIIVLLDLGLLGPVKFCQDLDVLVSEHSTRSSLPQLAHLSKSRSVLV